MDRWVGGEQAYRRKETDFHIFSSLLSRERASLCSSQNIFKLFLHFHYFTVSLFHTFSLFIFPFFSLFSIFFHGVTLFHTGSDRQSKPFTYSFVCLFVYMHTCLFYLFFMLYLHTKSPFFPLPSILVFFLSTITFQSYQQIVFSFFFFSLGHQFCHLEEVIVCGHPFSHSEVSFFSRSSVITFEDRLCHFFLSYFYPAP